MGVSVVIREPAVTVDPGRDARRQIVLRNTGSVVDQFTLSVRGDPAGWSRTKPETINLLPNEETVVELVFSPPRSHEVVAGEYPYAVRVLSREDEAGSAVHEGSVTVTAFTSVAAQLVPRTARARRKGRTTLAVDNLGNHGQRVGLLGYDQDDLLVFSFRPRSVRVEPGTATFVTVRPRPRKYFWRGSERAIPYEVDVRPADGEPLAVDGVLVQRPLLPRRSMLLFSALLALLLLGAMLLATLRQQTPTSQAGESPLIQATATPSSTVPASSTIVGSSSAVPTSSSAPPTTPTVPGAGGATGGGPGGVPTQPVEASNPDGFAVQADADPGLAGTYQQFGYVAPPGQTLEVASVRLQDTGSDVGTAEIQAPGGGVLISHDLAGLGEFDYQFDPPVQLGPGQQITLAVDCRTASTVCAPSATFAIGPNG
jgi:hypothetical protein